MIIKHLEGYSENEVEQLLEIPPEMDMGDYSLPCFSFAKRLKKSPVIIADQLKMDLEKDLDKSVISEIRNINGYLNIFLNKSNYIKFILDNTHNLELNLCAEGIEWVYKLLDTEFDYYLGESFYMDKVPALVTELKEKGLLEESQGANIVSLETYNMPPCLITKSDGSSIYHSRDMAAVLYRKKEFSFDKCLYVTGMEQKLHFTQVFKAIELMGYDWTSGLVHIPYGLVSLEGEKLSTRTGNIIYAEDILHEAIKRSSQLIAKKNPSLSNKDQIAEIVGIGAVIFHDLFNQRIKNVNFSWEEILNFDGTTGPYVQYTYARAKSILRKGDIDKLNFNIDTNLLLDDSSYNLAKEIASYPEKVKEAAARYEPSVVARYVWGLATVFNKFYQECNILNAEKDAKEARIVLVYLTQKIIKDAMELLGIKCPEEM